MRNLNSILKALGGFLTLCQEMASFPNVLKYTPDQPAAPNERPHAPMAAPSRLTDRTLPDACTSGSKYSPLNSASRVVEIVSRC